MKIGIVGAGNMGAALARLWVLAGHEVRLSFSRDWARLTAIADALGERASIAAPADAVAFDDVVLFAVPLGALGEALDAMGAAASGKVVVTTVSPYAADFSGERTTMTSLIGNISAAEHISALIPDAFVVEAFNLTFADMLALDPPFAKESRSVPICGDRDAAKAVVARLAVDAGLEPFDAGPLRSARAIEQMATAWVQLAAVSGAFPAAALKITKGIS